MFVIWERIYAHPVYNTRYPLLPSLSI